MRTGYFSHINLLAPEKIKVSEKREKRLSFPTLYKLFKSAGKQIYATFSGKIKLYLQRTA